jgi:hypothetical protein
MEVLEQVSKKRNSSPNSGSLQATRDAPPPDLGRRHEVQPFCLFDLGAALSELRAPSQQAYDGPLVRADAPQRTSL